MVSEKIHAFNDDISSLGSDSDFETLDTKESINIKMNNLENGLKKSNSVDNEQFKMTDNDLLYYDNSNVICFGIKKNLLIKRSLLPVVPGGIEVLLFNPSIRNSFYLFPLTIFGCCLILFINFPILVVQSNIKPAYFGKDLFIDKDELPYLDLTPEESQKFLINIKWMLIFLYSCLCSALSDYWLFKTQNTTSYFEIIGVTGGILKIFQLIAHMGGSFVLSRTRKNVLKHSRKNIDSSKKIEITDYR